LNDFALFVGHVEEQLGLVNGARIVFQAAHDRRINLDPVVFIPASLEHRRHGVQLADAFVFKRAGAGHKGDDCVDGRGLKTCPVCKVTTFVLAAIPEQEAHAFNAELVQFVDGSQNCQAAFFVCFAPKPDGLKNAVQDLPVVDPDDILTALNSEGFHRVRHHHAHLCVRLDAGRADRVGVELHELAEPAGSRLFVPEHPAGTIGPVGKLDVVDVFRDMSGERSGQIIAQAHPLLVFILNREDPCVRAIGIGQEFAEAVGIFEGRGLNRIEAVMLVDRTDLGEHFIRCTDVPGRAVGKAPRQAGLQFVRFFGHEVVRSRRVPCRWPSNASGDRSSFQLRLS